MPEYLTRYDETQRVELPGGFWVDIKRCITGTQKRAIRRKQITYGIEEVANPRGGPPTSRAVITHIDPDVFAYELAIVSIVDWNFESGGKKWPLSPEAAKRAHYDKLDEPDQDAIEAACTLANAEPTREEDAQFPTDGERGDAAGPLDASDVGQVLDGAEVLEPAGDPR